MELVISIVSWNTADLLRKCLASLRTHVNPATTRVVVIDNASKDGTPDMVRREFPEVQLIESGGNLGFGRAHNLIARATTEPFVLFLNPDTEFVEPAHERMLELMQRQPEIGLVGCRMENLDGSVQPLGFQWHNTPGRELLTNVLGAVLPAAVLNRLFPSHDPLSDGRVRKLYGGALLARREVLDRVGWFDDRFFMYGEDVDLSRRVDHGGYQSYYLSSARIIHLCGGASVRAPGRFSTLMQCESIAKLMEKYHGRIGRGTYVLAIFLRALLRLGVVGAARCVAALFRRPPSQRLAHAWSRHQAMLNWSLGRARAGIPQ
jgi:GT2 family glycosyltransferase